MMDFSGHAGVASDFDLLPNGQLAFAILNVRGVKTGGSGSQYLDVELTIDQGQPFAGRKLWDKIGHPFFQGNSEKYRQMGMIAITRICEAARNASPNNPVGYKLDNFEQLNGLRVPIKVGVEKGTDGHDDKNRVSEWLTPNPASQSGHKHYQKLISGEFNATSTTPANSNGFGAAPANGGGSSSQSQSSGFGGVPPQTPAAPGFGNPTPGFQQPPTDGSGQSGANGATTADNQSFGTGAAASPSDPGKTPGWLAQAGAPTT